MLLNFIQAIIIRIYNNLLAITRTCSRSKRHGRRNCPIVTFSNGRIIGRFILNSNCLADRYNLIYTHIKSNRSTFSYGIRSIYGNSTLVSVIINGSCCRVGAGNRSSATETAKSEVKCLVRLHQIIIKNRNNNCQGGTRPTRKCKGSTRRTIITSICRAICCSIININRTNHSIYIHITQLYSKSNRGIYPLSCRIRSDMRDRNIISIPIILDRTCFRASIGNRYTASACSRTVKCHSKCLVIFNNGVVIRIHCRI